MVAPLIALGMLAGAGAMGAKPHYENYAAGVRGRRNRSVLDGVDQQDPNAVAGALFGGGLLDGPGYLDAMEQQQANQLGWFNANTSRQNADTSRMSTEHDIFASTLGMVPTVQGPVDMRAATGALIHLESGGNPGAVSSRGALGLGQVMPANVGPWTEEILGTRLTPEQFAADPAAQKAVTEAKFGQYVQQYGLRDAYSMWHSGVPLAQAIREGRHDGNMSTADYVTAQMRGYEQRAAALAAEERNEFEVAAVGTYGSPAQQDLYDNTFTPPQVRSQIATAVIDPILNPAQAEPFGGEGMLRGQTEAYLGQETLLDQADAIVQGVDAWVDTIGSPSLTTMEQAGRLETQAAVESYIRESYKARTGGEMSDQAMNRELQNYPLPRSLGEGAVEWLLGGQRISPEAVKEFWRRERENAAQRTQEQRRRLGMVMSGQAPVGPEWSELPEGWEREQ